MKETEKEKLFTRAALKRTLEVIFDLSGKYGFDDAFIETGDSLGLREYYQNIDLDDCDLEDAYHKTWLVCKTDSRLHLLANLLSRLPNDYLYFTKVANEWVVQLILEIEKEKKI